MLATSDLHLLQANLRQLLDTAYFNKKLTSYTHGLISCIDHVLNSADSHPELILRHVSTFVWRAHRYLSGSVTKEIPYELEYALQSALTDWVTEDTAITMALLPDRSFHFNPVDPWDHIKVLLPSFKFDGFNSILIQIALPRLYKDKPLFNIPLYHELGHFIDIKFRISTVATELKYPGDLPPDDELAQEISHRQEYFADLFAACYVGEANGKMLSQIAPDAEASPSHPSTASRLVITSDFLTFKPNAEVSLLQRALKHRDLPALKVRSKALPGLAEAFDDLRPYPIADTAELHGIFDAGLKYLTEVRRNPSRPWKGQSPAAIDTAVNDLVEKSIRNVSIVQKWRDATPK